MKTDATTRPDFRLPPVRAEWDEGCDKVRVFVHNKLRASFGSLQSAAEHCGVLFHSLDQKCTQVGSLVVQVGMLQARIEELEQEVERLRDRAPER